MFAATLKLTDALPVPDAALVMLIHPSLVLAVHAHPEPVTTETFTLPVPPAAAIDAPPGLKAKLHAAAACDTVKVRPAIVIVPVRAPSVFAATLNVTDAAPLPDAGLTVIHDVFETAVHAHPAVVDTATVPLPADAPMEALADPSAKAHDGGAGEGAGGGAGAGSGRGAGPGVGAGDGAGGATTICSCAIVTLCPAITTTPLRGGPLFPPMVSVTVADAFPLFPVVTSIQGACDTAVQLHPVSVSTVTATVPPAADTVVFGGATAK